MHQAPRFSETERHRAQLFPFWIVARPGDSTPVGLASPGSGYVAAFISAESALAYMDRDRDARSELHLVCRATFAELAERLRSLGLSGLCFEPNSQGRGDRITLAQMSRLLSAPP